MTETRREVLEKLFLGTAGLALGAGCSNDTIDDDDTTNRVARAPAATPTISKRNLQKVGSCDDVDILYVFDNSGSMTDEIAQALSSAEDIMGIVDRLYDSSQFGVASLGLNDASYNLVTSFTSENDLVVGGIRSLTSTAGGVERSGAALIAGLNENGWRDNAHRIILLYTDEGPENPALVQRAMQNPHADIFAITSSSDAFSYWNNAVDSALPLADSRNFKGMTLRAIMQGCGDYPDVSFESGKWDLSSSDKTELDSLADLLLSKEGLGVQIEGHADERGTADYNHRLGIMRAQAVAKYLRGKGVVAAATSYGESRPICQTSEDWCLEENRKAHLFPIVVDSFPEGTAQNIGPNPFDLAGVGEDHVVYSFRVRASRDVAGNIAQDFNFVFRDEDKFGTVRSSDVYLDANLTQKAGSNTRRSNPVYVRVPLK